MTTREEGRPVTRYGGRPAANPVGCSDWRERYGGEGPRAKEPGPFGDNELRTAVAEPRVEISTMPGPGTPIPRLAVRVQ
ncbi:hypothetical protein [Streptomyces sp. NBC_00582]|uniref:hypothetical protein n=1 Tax=Streptomyces sp. NBC_00582 TaxID=2975783 RepID=UPI002E80DE57|nr:hypothetical protein [Streptomyces sp. NBC_00582]WUB59389.1 hypothetical protein OG852_02725 [Streptomyces sp. NBC_00582]